MACRVPGADTPGEFWQNISQKVESVTAIPPERWDAGAHEALGFIDSPAAGVIEKPFDFDAAFFGIPPREAKHLDPQHRLLLQVAYEACEDAGLPLSRLAERDIGVFHGIGDSDHSHYALENPARVEGYTSTGGLTCGAPNRLSFIWDLRGPSVAVNTACSSALVALHLAKESLWRGESEIALVGGSNLLLHPGPQVSLTRFNALSPSGRCSPFSQHANGYVRGEGVIVLVLRPLEAALADGDRVYATVLGSAMNQDGRSSGLTAPNPAAQVGLLRKAHRDARIDISELSYIEAHATGTPLGDPIEMQALGTVLQGENRSALRVGSVKANIGHLEAAAGLAGVLKTILAIHHQALPPSLHAEPLNERIDFQSLGIEVQKELTSWPDSSQRIAGVSAFGITGTNAHVVLGAGPTPQQQEADHVADGEARLFVTSARSGDSLTRRCEALAARLDTTPARVADLAWTAARRMDHHRHRIATVVRDEKELARALRTGNGLQRGSVAMGRRSRTVMVFSGHGAQWPGMGVELLSRDAVFRAAVQDCDAALRPHLGWSILDSLAEGRGGDAFAEIQPLLFAVQIGLAARWRDWGVEPSVVLGHSMGEVAAAYVARALSLEDAARVIACRSMRLAELAGRGKMAVLGEDVETARQWLQDYPNVGVAGLNGPQSTLVAGDGAEIDALVDKAKSAGLLCRHVRVDVPSHSPQVAAITASLRADLSAIEPSTPEITLISTVTAKPLQEPPGPEYWVRNAREPVLFYPALQEVLQRRAWLVEVAAHPVLSASMAAAVEQAGRESLVVASMRRDEDPPQTLLTGLGRLYCAGSNVSWDSLFPANQGSFVAFPPYPWDCEPLEPPWQADAGGEGGVYTPCHVWLTHRFSAAGGEVFWSGSLSLDDWPFLADHRVQGAAVLPGAAYLDLATTAVLEETGLDAVRFSDVRIREALVLESEARLIQLQLSFDGRGGGAFSLWSWQQNEWVQHVEGAFAAPTQPPRATLAGRPETAKEVDTRAFYRHRETSGNSYGPSFRRLDQIWFNDELAGGTVTADEATGEAAGQHYLNPALLDAAGQLLTVFAADESGAFMPVGLESGTVRRRLAGTLETRAVLTHRESGRVQGDIYIFDAAGLVVELRGLEFRYIDSRAPTTSPRQWLYRTQWIEITSHGKLENQHWCVLGDDSPERARVEASLHGLGAHVSRAPNDAPAPFDGFVSILHAPTPNDVTRFAPLLEGVHHHAAMVRELPKSTAARWWVVIPGGPSPDGTDDTPAGGALASLVNTLSGEWDGPPISVAACPSDALDAESLSGLWTSNETKAWAGRGKALAARLQQVTESPTKSLEPAADGAYLITGGLGELGLAVAHRLAERGARRLILISRTPLPPRASWAGLDRQSREWRRAQKVLELERIGCHVSVECLDIQDHSAVAAWFERYQHEQRPKIRGAVHAAGVLSTGEIAQLEAEEAVSVASPKWNGALALEPLLADADFVVGFSSISASVSSPGLGAYAAANGALTAWCRRRATRGRRCVAIEWGPWANGGMASRRTTEEKSAMAGLFMMPTTGALDAFERALATTDSQLLCAAVDWQRWGEVVPRFFEDPYLAHLAAEEVPDPPSQAPEDDASADGQESWLIDRIRAEVATLLGVAADAIDPLASFSQLGLDSLMLARLQGRLKRSCGLDLSPLEFQRAPSIEALAQRSDNSLAPGESAAVTESASGGRRLRDSGIPEVVLRDADTGLNLFLVHPAMGADQLYADVLPAVSADFRVVAYEMRRTPEPDDPTPGASEHGFPLAKPAIVDVATAALEAIRRWQPEGPYWLAGWCAGGIVATEIANRLRRDGEAIASVHLFDSPPPTLWSEWDPAADRAMLARNIGFNYGVQARTTRLDLQGLSDDEQLKVVLAELQELGALDPSTTLEDMRAMDALHTQATGETLIGPLREHVQQRLHVPVVLYHAIDELAPRPSYIEEWTPYTPAGVEVVDTPGDHFTMFAGENGAKLGRELDARLAEARRKRSNSDSK